jgi:hypothetical protein
VARAEKARQREGRIPRQQASFTQEGIGLVDRLQCELRNESALALAPL